MTSEPVCIKTRDCDLDYGASDRYIYTIGEVEEKTPLDVYSYVGKEGFQIDVTVPLGKFSV